MNEWFLTFVRLQNRCECAHVFIDRRALYSLRHFIANPATRIEICAFAGTMITHNLCMSEKREWQCWVELLQHCTLQNSSDIHVYVLCNGFQLMRVVPSCYTHWKTHDWWWRTYDSMQNNDVLIQCMLLLGDVGFCKLILQGRIVIISLVMSRTAVFVQNIACSQLCLWSNSR